MFVGQVTRSLYVCQCLRALVRRGYLCVTAPRCNLWLHSVQQPISIVLAAGFIASLLLSERQPRVVVVVSKRKSPAAQG